MSLASAPTFNPGSTGGIYGGAGGASLAASTSHTVQFSFGCSSGNTGSLPTSALYGRLQIIDTGGSAVAVTNGLQVQLYSSSDAGATEDSVPFVLNQTITTIASTAAAQSWDIPPGNYFLKLSNLDATYAITVTVTLGYAA
jgi:hypothetical protein